METVEIQTTAIETNVRTLIKTHPSPKRFMETLRNEAIDQAFQEVDEKLEILSERIYYECASNLEVEKLQEQIEILKKHVEFLEKRTHRLIPKLEE